MARCREKPPAELAAGTRCAREGGTGTGTGREGGRVLRVLPGQVRAQPAPRVAATPIRPAPATETAGPAPDPSRDPPDPSKTINTGPANRLETARCGMAPRTGRAGRARLRRRFRPARHDTRAWIRRVCRRRPASSSGLPGRAGPGHAPAPQAPVASIQAWLALEK